MAGKFRLVHCELGFMVLLCCGLFVLTRVSPSGLPHPRWPIQLGWALVTTLICYASLDMLNYFDSFRPYPSVSKLLTLYLALVLPVVGAKQVFFIFAGEEILRIREILVGLVSITTLAWCYQRLAGLFFVRTQGKRHLWLAFDDKAGAETLKAEFANCGLAPYYALDGGPESAELVVISRSGHHLFGLGSDLLMAHLQGVPVRDLRFLLTEIRGRESVDSLDLWFFLMTATPQRRMFRFFFRIKSLFEPLLAAMLLVLLVPLACLIALGILASGKGQVFYRQERLGYKGKKFALVKFRTMRPDAEAAGPAWAGQQQSKVTPFGSFLRRSHLDEIPQLWNVLRGEMSFVGPRPERPEYYELLRAEIPLFWMRTLVRPGITGWAQVRGGYASSVAESREKLEYDLYYMKRMSPVMDLTIFVKTLLILLSARDELAQ